MIRVVLDANVIISGAGRRKQPVSPPAQLLIRAIQGAFELITSSPLVHEVERTLEEPYFASRVDFALREEVLGFLRERSLYDLAISATGGASHPEDDLILATAVSASADFLVTGDKMLLKLGSYSGVIIMSPSSFLEYLESR